MIEVQFDLQIAVAWHPFDELSNGMRQSDFGQRNRAQVVRQVPGLAHNCVDLFGHGPATRAKTGNFRKLIFDFRHEKLKGDQRLPDHIVNFPCDSAAFLFLRS